MNKKEKTQGLTITSLRQLDKTFYTDCIISIPKINKLKNITFLNCKFTFKGCLKSAILEGVKFLYCKLENIDFSGTSFINECKISGPYKPKGSIFTEKTFISEDSSIPKYYTEEELNEDIYKVYKAYEEKVLKKKVIELDDKGNKACTKCHNTYTGNVTYYVDDGNTKEQICPECLDKLMINNDYWYRSYIKSDKFGDSVLYIFDSFEKYTKFMQSTCDKIEKEQGSKPYIYTHPGTHYISLCIDDTAVLGFLSKPF